MRRVWHWLRAWPYEPGRQSGEHQHSVSIDGIEYDLDEMRARAARLAEARPTEVDSVERGLAKALVAVCDALLEKESAK